MPMQYQYYVGQTFMISFSTASVLLIGSSGTSEAVSSTNHYASKYDNQQETVKMLFGSSSSKSLNNNHRLIVADRTSTGEEKPTNATAGIRSRHHVESSATLIEQIGPHYLHQANMEAAARPNASSLDVLCQIFPGRSRHFLESMLKVIK